MFTKEDKEKYMELAFEQAEVALSHAEVPIGAVIVDDGGLVIGAGYNRREIDQDALGHAELLAIAEACKNVKSWRLENCSIFITLEPCSMCAGAIINSRIASVYYAANDQKAGAAGSVVDLFTVEKFNHHPRVYPGLYARRAAQMLKDFFREIREQKKQSNSK